MTEKEVRRYLEGHFYAEKKIKALENEIAQLRIDAQGIGSPLGGIPSSSQRNSTEQRFIEFADREAELIMQVDQLRNEQKEIRKTISKLDDNDLEAVLIYRFILHNTTEQTAELMNYAVRTVANKQKLAVKKLSAKKFA